MPGGQNFPGASQWKYAGYTEVCGVGGYGPAGHQHECIRVVSLLEQVVTQAARFAANGVDELKLGVATRAGGALAGCEASRMTTRTVPGPRASAPWPRATGHSSAPGLSEP
jgi:hypothetical protein